MMNCRTMFRMSGYNLSSVRVIEPATIDCGANGGYVMEVAVRVPSAVAILGGVVALDRRAAVALTLHTHHPEDSNPTAIP